MSRQATFITAAFFAATVCQAQSPVFEAVSIKPSSADAGGRSLSQNPGPRLSTSNATLRMLVMFAYQLMPDQISGGPGWVESDGFDVEAKGANPNATMGEFRRMVQAMLAERFHLQVHRATKELPVYALVQAKGGAKLTEAHGEDSGTGADVDQPIVLPRERFGLAVDAVDELVVTVPAHQLGRRHG